MRGKKRRLKKGAVAAFAIVICALVAVIAGIIYHRQQTLAGSDSAQASSVSAVVSVSSSDSASSGNVSSESSQSDSTSSASASDTAVGGLLALVNKDNELPSDYVPNLVKISSDYYYSTEKDTQFDERAAEYLKKFITAGRKAGFDDMCVLSGYRTYAYQKSNYERHVKQFEAKGETSSQAETDAAAIVAPPGTSEHELGLAADIITSSWYGRAGELTAEFDTTDAFAWLSSNCAKYGFILRYPENKVSETGYDYEPWHYRFVGVDNAKKIMDSGLSLEEYVAKLK